MSRKLFVETIGGCDECKWCKSCDLQPPPRCGVVYRDGELGSLDNFPIFPLWCPLEDEEEEHPKRMIRQEM